MQGPLGEMRSVSELRANSESPGGVPGRCKNPDVSLASATTPLRPPRPDALFSVHYEPSLLYHTPYYSSSHLKVNEPFSRCHQYQVFSTSESGLRSKRCQTCHSVHPQQVTLWNYLQQIHNLCSAKRSHSGLQRTDLRTIQAFHIASIRMRLFDRILPGDKARHNFSQVTRRSSRLTCDFQRLWYQFVSPRPADNTVADH